MVRLENGSHKQASLAGSTFIFNRSRRFWRDHFWVWCQLSDGDCEFVGIGFGAGDMGAIRLDLYTDEACDMDEHDSRSSCRSIANFDGVCSSQ